MTKPTIEELERILAGGDGPQRITILPNGEIRAVIADTDWGAVVESCPPLVREHFAKARAARVEQAKRLLEAHERNEGGLTTYVREGSHARDGHLTSLGRDLEMIDMEARINRVGVVEAYRQLAEK